MARILELDDFGFFSILYATHAVAFAFFNGAIIEGFLVLSSGRFKGDLLYRNLVYRLLALYVLFLSTIFLTIYSLFGIISILNILSLLFASIFINLAYFIRRALQIDGQAYASALFSGLMFLIFCSFLWLSDYYVFSSINSTFMIFGSSNLICCLLFYKVIQIPFKPINYQDSLSRYKEHINYSKWVLLTAIVIQGASQGYIWLIGAQLSLADLGIYRALFNIVMPISMLCTGLSLTCVPMLSSKHTDGDTLGYKKIFINIIFCSTGIALILYTVIWFYGSWILNIVYANNFSDYTNMLNILALGAIVTIIVNPFNDYSKSIEEPSRILYAYSTAAITTFTVGYYLITKYALIGAAWGFVLTNISFGIILIAYYCLDMKSSVVDYFKSKSS